MSGFLKADQYFSEPGWFWLLLLLPVLGLVYWFFLRRQFPVLLLSQIPGDPEKKSPRSVQFSPPDLLFGLRLLALAFLGLALADLVEEKVIKTPVPAEGIDIVLALDLSRSMAIEDIKPNRLEALKDVLNQFIASRNQDRLGVVLYAGESLNWCPLTKDHPFLLTRLREMDDKYLNDGTAIGLGLASAVNALKASKTKSKVVILMTDGANNTGFIDPITAARIAKKYGVKVYTIGIGTTGKAPFPMYDLNGNKFYQYLDVKLDENMLRKIAEATGGQYYRATTAGALSQVYAQIDKLEKTSNQVKYEKEITPLYHFFLLAALGLLALEFLLKHTLFFSFV